MNKEAFTKIVPRNNVKPDSWNIPAKISTYKVRIFLLCTLDAKNAIMAYTLKFNLNSSSFLCCTCDHRDATIKCTPD